MKTIIYIATGLLASLNLHAVLNLDFEVNVAGITSVYVPGEPTTPNIVRVPPGGFIPTSPSSQGGSFFAEVAMLFDDSGTFVSVQGDRVKWNTGGYTGGFVSGAGFNVDVFFDDPQFYDGDGGFSTDGFFFQPTILDPSNGFAVNGGGFGARVVDTGGVNDPLDYVWHVGADGNAKGFEGVSSFTPITTGWFTMSTIWKTNLISGDIDQVNTLTDISTGTVVYTEVIEDVIAAGQAGALGAASIGNGDLDQAGTRVGPISRFGDLAIDNVSIVPETSAFALVLGVMGLSLASLRRRR